MKRPTAIFDENYHSGETLSISSPVFTRLQRIYLVGYLLVAAGDNLQGAYRYALYQSYGMNRSLIELFQVFSYGSSLLLGTFIASLADRYGRRRACFLCILFNILYCFLFNFSVIWILAIGIIFEGIGRALHETAFEAWLIQEHRERSLNVESLKRILRNAFVSSALVSVAAGIIAQFAVEWTDYRAPFDLAIIFFLLTAIFIGYFWSENYGDKDSKTTTTFISAFQVVRADPRIVLLGFSLAFVDAAFYIFIIEWTPLLQRAYHTTNKKSVPLGFFFALMLFVTMVGSFIFDPLAKRIRVQSFMIVVLLLSAIGTLTMAVAPDSVPTVLAGLVLYEICIGIYRPSAGLLRSQYVPNEVRATIMNYMRVPQIICMLIILLSHFSIPVVFILCAVLNLLAMILMIILRSLKLPEEQAYIGEAQILLDEPSSPSFKIKEPQKRASSLASLIPQTSATSEDLEQPTLVIDKEDNR